MPSIVRQFVRAPATVLPAISPAAPATCKPAFIHGDTTNRPAELARAHGVNANQVRKWRRSFELDELIEACSALLPISASRPAEREDEAGTEAAQLQGASSGAIHIELPGRLMISIESGADPVRSVERVGPPRSLYCQRIITSMSPEQVGSGARSRPSSTGMAIDQARRATSSRMARFSTPVCIGSVC